LRRIISSIEKVPPKSRNYSTGFFPAEKTPRIPQISQIKQEPKVRVIRGIRGVFLANQPYGFLFAIFCQDYIIADLGPTDENNESTAIGVPGYVLSRGFSLSPE
jgi:hypothetical protein